MKERPPRLQRITLWRITAVRHTATARPLSLSASSNGPRPPAGSASAIGAPAPASSRGKVFLLSPGGLLPALAPTEREPAPSSHVLANSAPLVRRDGPGIPAGFEHCSI